MLAVPAERDRPVAVGPVAVDKRALRMRGADLLDGAPMLDVQNLPTLPTTYRPPARVGST